MNILVNPTNLDKYYFSCGICGYKRIMNKTDFDKVCKQYPNFITQDKYLIINNNMIASIKCTKCNVGFFDISSTIDNDRIYNLHSEINDIDPDFISKIEQLRRSKNTSRKSSTIYCKQCGGNGGSTGSCPRCAGNGFEP